jgi:hypothetical protein
MRRQSAEIWAILWTDKLRLVEVVSGLLLVALRGSLVFGAPDLAYVDYRTSLLLEQVHLDANRWGLYLIVLGLIQVALAGSRHTWLRLIVAFLILAGFTVLAAAFWETGGFRGVPVSLHCMGAFYTYLFARLLVEISEQKQAAKVVEEVMNGG